MPDTDSKNGARWEERLRAYREQLSCGFPQVAEVFEDCMREALAVLSSAGVGGYLDTARFLGGMGRGVEPVLVFLEEWPPIARTLSSMEPWLARARTSRAPLAVAASSPNSSRRFMASAICAKTPSWSRAAT